MLKLPWLAWTDCFRNYEIMRVSIIGSRRSDPILVGRAWCLNSNNVPLARLFEFKVEGNLEMKVMGGGWHPGVPLLDWPACKTRVWVRNVWSTCEAHEWKRRKDVPVGMNHERTRSQPTDAEPTTAGSVSSYCSQDSFRWRRRTRKASERKCNNRWIHRNRSNHGDFHPEELKLVECNNQLVNGEGRWVQERQKWRGELQRLTWYSLFDHFQCFFHWITQKCSRRLGRIGSSS